MSLRIVMTVEVVNQQGRPMMATQQVTQSFSNNAQAAMFFKSGGINRLGMSIASKYADKSVSKILGDL